MTSNKIKINLDSLKSRRDWKRHKVKDGHNIFRVLPPFGESSNGYPYRKWQIIWGLSDPDTGRARPFASSLTTEKRCPVYEYVDKLKAKAEQIKSTLQSRGESDEAIRTRLTDLNKLISDLSPKTVYVYNAVDQSGEVGLLELKSTAHKKMKIEMGQYIQDYNQDPTSLNSNSDDSGVWFDVVRTGQFRDTEYDVKKHQLKVKDPQTGRITFQDNQTALPDSVVENYANLAYDLSAVYQIKSYEDLEEILLANIPHIESTCPDAILGDNVIAAVEVKKQAKPVSTAKITTRLDDEDDAEETVVVPKATVKATATAQIDDDFLAEADALLNS